MAEHSKIEWTDATWPVVQGCDYESPGCTHCYAVPLLWRMAHHPDPKISAQLQGVVNKDARGKLHFTGKVALREDRLDWPLRWREPRRIFGPSHGDLFHPAVPDEFIDRVFAVMQRSSRHTYQLLTKRSDRMRDYVTKLYADADSNNRRWFERGFCWPLWSREEMARERVVPFENLWLGVSVEDQPRADERIPHLLATPAAVRFLSCEPLLGPVDLSAWVKPETPWLRKRGHACLDWVIAGGESGPGARPMHPDWARSLRDQCAAAGVPFFHKQNGEYASVSEIAGAGEHHYFPDGATVRRVGKKAAGRLLDGREWNEFPRGASDDR